MNLRVQRYFFSVKQLNEKTVNFGGKGEKVERVKRWKGEKVERAKGEKGKYRGTGKRLP